MSLRAFVQRLFHPVRPAAEPASTPMSARQDGRDPGAAEMRAQAAAWLEALESGRLAIPRDLHDASDWDRYWTNQMKVGPIDQGFADMMSSDPGLPALLHDRGVRTILCAGNGLSQEAMALALFGFDVTAMDISKVPADVFCASFARPEDPQRPIPDGGAVDSPPRFSVAGPIDPSLCPKIHAGECEPRVGGSIAFVTGSLFHEGLCPGPFDAVIERRVLQLFADEADRIGGLERLVARLAPRGVFVSHQHSGGWRPGEPREHYAEAWLVAHGFTIGLGRGATEPEAVPDAPLARLVYTSG